MDFRQAWRRVGELAGREFLTDRGQPFRYRFKRTFVVVEPGDLSIPRTNFEKVLRCSPQPVQGQRYIQAVYAHPDFQAD